MQDAPAPVQWHDIKNPPVGDVLPIALWGVIECDCGRGARVVVTGAYVDGQWVSDCQHSVRFVKYLILPDPDLAVN